MNILFLAPQPFYQHRGSPIAIKLVLEILAERGDHVDVLTYNEGEPVKLAGVKLRRTPDLPFLRNIRPGFSFKKIICDVFMTVMAIGQCLRNRYALIHAVEESVYIALLLHFIWGTPYIYDMDSSLPEQLIEKHSWLSFMLPFMRWFERLAVRHALVTVPVCDALRETIRDMQAKQIVTLYDVPLPSTTSTDVNEDLREGTTGYIALYVGNLEPYQGIDLLLESFAIVLRRVHDLTLVVIGGREDDIALYQRQSQKLGIENSVRFLGMRPATLLSTYLAQADILVSPRIKGSNTPMKIYSYLQSGKPILATNLSTHTQVLDDHVALLTAATPPAYAVGLIRLANDPCLRETLGEAGKRLVAEKYSYARFHETFTTLMTDIQTDIEAHSKTETSRLFEKYHS